MEKETSTENTEEERETKRAEDCTTVRGFAKLKKFKKSKKKLVGGSRRSRFWKMCER